MTSNELSRLVSHALRHAPAEYGLTTAGDGSVELVDLARGLSERARVGNISVSDIETMVASQTKRRHVIEGTRIRALYGHSQVDVEISGSDEPPSVLFHATNPAVVSQIVHEGLRQMRRRYVHLASDQSTAIAVGKRKASEPALLIIDAAGAAAAGVTFRHSGEVTWTSDPIPPRFIKVAGQAPPGGAA